MKPLQKFVIVLSLFLILPSLQAAELGRKEYALLIEDILPQHSREQLIRMVGNSEKFRPDEVKYAKEQIEKAKVAVRKLRAIIKVGNSILDYPGLLSRGFIRYENLDDSGYYTLIISAADEGRLGVADPTGFDIQFNDLGHIIAIKNPQVKGN